MTLMITGIGEAVRALNASLDGLLASPVEVTRWSSHYQQALGSKACSTLTAARELPLVSACASAC